MEPFQRLVAPLLLLLAAVLPGQFVDLPWRFTTSTPPAGWQATDFEDEAWQVGPGGFGERGTPAIRVGTVWSDDDIWLRRTVALDSVPERPALYLFHDEATEVFVNGQQVAALTGYSTEYIVVVLDAKARAALRAGDNLLAVHCHQTTGGQGIDVHLIDTDNVPRLPPPPRPERPFQTELITSWGEVVTPQNAWREYPRPGLVRERWQNLNGEWDYAITAMAAARPTQWQGRILVPFCLESRLGGVQRLLYEDQALWYRREWQVAATSGQRTLLHFEACDYQTQAWLGDVLVGEHVGGNTPFTFDLTDALQQLEPDAPRWLYVKVTDATGGYQLRGKQARDPNGIWYTRVSGIWGTVWSEQVPTQYIERLTTKTKLDGTVTIDMHSDVQPATAVASLHGVEVARAQGTGTLTLKLAAPELWSPDAPTLYDLVVTSGEDTVRSYFGVREVSRVRDQAGNYRLTLNGAPIFHWGPLDQGWWPDGLLTPPSEAAMRWDVDYLKAAGFNMIRKHIKVEPRSYYAYCDRIGMMVWQDQVAAGHGPRWTHLQPAPQDANWPEAASSQFVRELDAMITTLENHPSIVVWVPFNEAWGQHDTVFVGKWTMQRDPSRLVNIASGGNFWPVGHICDEHQYPHPSFPFELGANGRFADFALVVGEFGGHGLPVAGHLWRDQRKNWGYGSLPKDAAEYQARYRESIRRLVALQAKVICGAVYTQTTDVEGEINGLVTYDRKHVKFAAAELRQLHAALFGERH